MFHAAPRTWAAASLHRNSAISPSCCGVTNSPEGCFSASSWALACSGSTPSAMRLSIYCCTSGVSTQPGQMALQVMPLRAVSRATVLVSPTTACLAAT
ncbi:Uncharacterised protein [Klebsiella pneumoniae]|uniref:Uncharacterized protein n=1 Tax=Klebsiella pneumoniae TaxID=573 RepID=A0A377TUS3_KLEPN|nr:Uncharacterised protein [Klebsiella pneumoniae]